jgi:hypothetical protein
MATMRVMQMSAQGHELELGEGGEARLRMVLLTSQ